MLDIMTKQKALEELKTCVRGADWTDEDYVDCVSKEALNVAIEALEQEVSMYCGLETMAENMERSGETQEIRALLRDEEVKQMIKKDGVEIPNPKGIGMNATNKI